MRDLRFCLSLHEKIIVHLAKIRRKLGGAEEMLSSDVSCCAAFPGNNPHCLSLRRLCYGFMQDVQKILDPDSVGYQPYNPEANGYDLSDPLCGE